MTSTYYLRNVCRSRKCACKTEHELWVNFLPFLQLRYYARDLHFIFVGVIEGFPYCINCISIHSYKTLLYCLKRTLTIESNLWVAIYTVQCSPTTHYTTLTAMKQCSCAVLRAPNNKKHEQFKCPLSCIDRSSQRISIWHGLRSLQNIQFK